MTSTDPEPNEGLEAEEPEDQDAPDLDEEAPPEIAEDETSTPDDDPSVVYEEPVADEDAPTEES